MYSLPKLGEQLRAIAAELAWRQWAALGQVAVSARQAQSIVDPEALLLLSLGLADRDGRIKRLIPWWAHVGARLLSVQRAKNLVAEYPPGTGAALGRFARSAVTDGGDHRWKALAGRTDAGPARPKDLGAGPLVSAPPALMLRLRLAFGVGIKSDVLAFLLGTAGERCTVQQVAGATRYYPRAVRRALEELAAAQFAMTASSAPISYQVDEKAWSALLSLRGGPPPWRPWQDVFAFMSQLLAWVEARATARASDYLLSSKARDLAEAHGAAFDGFGVALRDPGAFPGEAYLEPFTEATRQLVERLLDVA